MEAAELLDEELLLREPELFDDEEPFLAAPPLEPCRLDCVLLADELFLPVVPAIVDFSYVYRFSTCHISTQTDCLRANSR